MTAGGRAAASTRPGLATWWQGARPRTLGASIVPVLAGSAAVHLASPPRAALALVVAVGLQVGVNYLNDYQDGVGGVDTAARTGPVRLVASGLATPESVRAAGLLALGVAGAAGVALAATSEWWLLALGGAAILATVAYSGGPRPYGAMGLGEVAVFVFFGLAGTCGTAYVEAGAVNARAIWAACVVGLLAAAILSANNLRDIETDARAGKRTLATRLGERRARALYRGEVAAAFALVPVGVALGALPVTALLALAALPLAWRPMALVGVARGRDLVPVLLRTAALQVAAGLGLALGLWAR